MLIMLVLGLDIHKDLFKRIYDEKQDPWYGKVVLSLSLILLILSIVSTYFLYWRKRKRFFYLLKVGVNIFLATVTAISLMLRFLAIDGKATGEGNSISRAYMSNHLNINVITHYYGRLGGILIAFNVDVQTAIMLFVALLLLIGKIIFNYENREPYCEPYSRTQSNELIAAQSESSNPAFSYK